MPRIKCIVKEKRFYDSQRLRVGQEYIFEGDKKDLPKWLEPIEAGAKAPEKPKTKTKSKPVAKDTDKFEGAGTVEKIASATEAEVI